MALVNTLLTLPMFNYFCPRQMFKESGEDFGALPEAVPSKG